MDELSTGNLLIEFLTEELPPINLEKNIGESFATLLFHELQNYTSTTPEFFVTPRRFACLFKQISATTTDQIIYKKGPSIISGLKDNQPTNALRGFMKSYSIDDLKQLEQRDDGYFYTKQTILGQSLVAILPPMIETALKKLPVAKSMRSGNNNHSFVRPIHNLMIIFNDKVICEDSSIFGLSPVNYTYGHRVMSTGKIILTDALKYSESLYTNGSVIASFVERKNSIKEELNKKAGKLNLQINHIASLLDEVTALVEHPVVLVGEFNPEFLEVPQECLILSMAKNQKYFSLVDVNNKLSNKFLFVANIASTNPQVIINGNEKVLSARLSDAKFFYDVDRNHSLAYFNDKLQSVVYHNKLGSQYDRVQRLQKIAPQIATLMKLNPEESENTAKLLKFDLNTEMVGEFPELQGIMGKYYALYYNQSYDIANAIEQHYYPRFSGDILPNTPLAITMALSDKLEAIVGIWGIGLVPSGEKDPFALRRAALGIARILLEYDLNLHSLLKITFEAFSSFNLNLGTQDEIYKFILERLNNYLVNVENYPINLVNSVLLPKPPSFNYLHSLLRSLQQFSSSNSQLINANKRIKNILEKNGYNTQAVLDKPNPRLFKVTEEQNLYNTYIKNVSTLHKHYEEQNWDSFFATLSNFNEAISDFFDNVMVMDKNEIIKKNRIDLLKYMYDTFNQVCELAEI